MKLTVACKESVARFLSSDDTFASVLLTILIDQYGMEVLEWSAVTIWAELYEDFGVRLSRLNQDKILAMITALTTDQFFRDALAFGHITDALNNTPIDFETITPTEPEDMAWSISEVVAFNGHPDIEFSAEVKRYIGCCLLQYGVYSPPDVLKLADYPKEELDAATRGATDNPTLYAASQGRNREINQNIIKFLKTRMGAMMKQFNEAPIENRNTESWNAFQNQGRK